MWPETAGRKRTDMRNIRVALWGFGAMGGGIAKVLLQKEGVEITGVCDLHPKRVGKSIYELLGEERGERPDVIVQEDIDAALPKHSADVCIVRRTPLRGTYTRNFCASLKAASTSSARRRR